LTGLLAALVVMYGLFSWKLPSFHSIRTLETLARQSVTTILVALGLTFVIVAGGIDLSVGSVAAFSGVIVAICLMHGWPAFLAALAGIGIGAVAGLINGVLITKLRVVPFIVTLGALSAFRGAAKGCANEQSVYAPDSKLNNLMRALGPTERWQVFPSGVWITIFCAAVMGLVLRFTRFGRHVIAVGSNESAARLCGVPIDRVKMAVYALSGLFSGLCGLMFFSRLTIGDPTGLVGLELDGIAAAVIGGASLSGGQGTILGSILGALIMATLKMGFTEMDLKNWIQEIVTGGIIIFAVALDRIRRARSS